MCAFNVGLKARALFYQFPEISKFGGAFAQKKRALLDLGLPHA